MTEPSSTDHPPASPSDTAAEQAPEPAAAAEPDAPPAPPAAEAPDAEGPAKSGRGMLIVVLAAVGLLVVALITFILVSQKADDTEEGTPRTPASTVPADQFATYEDAQFGFSIGYPQSWNRLNVAPGNRRLVVQEQGANALSVSVLGTLGQSDLRTFARNTIAQSSPDVQILAEHEITLSGAPGFYFLYTFRLDGTGPLALHAHYFLVRDGEMLTLVFQAAPASEFERLAPVFDQVADTLTFGPVAATTTTVASATTVP